MYKQFFGLTCPPFHNTPDPAFLFESRSHREALASMAYGVLEGKGFVVVTGDVGSGKTLLVQALKRELGDRHVLVDIANPWVTPETVQTAILASIGLDKPGDFALWDAFKQRLADLAAEGRRVVLIIDEAHQLPTRTLESLCVLSNLETATQKLIQIVLVGQNELGTLLGEYSLRQLHQRITLRSCLQRLNAEETGRYIQHRLRVAGGSPHLFPPECVDLIYRESLGTPRVINNLCDKCLLFAFGRNSVQVTLQITQDAIAALWPERVSVMPHVPVEKAPKASDSACTMPHSEAPKTDETADDMLFPAFDFSPILSREETHLPLRAEREMPFELPFADKAPPAPSARPSVQAPATVLRGMGTRIVLLLALFAVSVGALGFWLGNGEFFGSMYLSAQKSLQSVGLGAGEKQTPRNDAPLPPSAVADVAGKSPRSLDVDAPALSGERSMKEAPGAGRTGVVPESLPPMPGSLPSALKSREEKVSSKEPLSVLATRHYGAWNEAVRDLLATANPDVPSFDNLPAGTRILFPLLNRDNLLVKDAQGRYFVYFASFDKPEFARMNLDALKRSFSAAQLFAGERQGVSIQRLFIGPFASQIEALAVADSLWFKYLPILN